MLQNFGNYVCHKMKKFATRWSIVSSIQSSPPVSTSKRSLQLVAYLPHPQYISVKIFSECVSCCPASHSCIILTFPAPPHRSAVSLEALCKDQGFPVGCLFPSERRLSLTQTLKSVLCVSFLGGLLAFYFVLYLFI